MTSRLDDDPVARECPARLCTESVGPVLQDQAPASGVFLDTETHDELLVSGIAKVAKVAGVSQSHRFLVQSLMELADCPEHNLAMGFLGQDNRPSLDQLSDKRPVIGLGFGQLAEKAPW
jgi:hypothetical protein